MSDKPNVDHATAKFMADQWTSAIEAREAMVAEVAQLKAERDRLRKALRDVALFYGGQWTASRPDYGGSFPSSEMLKDGGARARAALSEKEPRDE